MSHASRSTVVITGASSGIGRELALEMARRGHALGLTARRLPLLETLREEIRALHGDEVRGECAPLELCATCTVAAVLSGLFDRLGGVDTVVANAGINDLTEIGTSLDRELAMIQTNLGGAIATVDAAAAHFRARG